MMQTETTIEAVILTEYGLIKEYSDGRTEISLCGTEFVEFNPEEK